jgi:hypothetical protein
MARTVRADVDTARRAVHLRRDRLEHRSQSQVRLSRAARHDRRAEKRPFLATGHATADEMQAPVTKGGLASPGVHVVGVATVDDDVALVEQRGELFDHRVGARARLHHHDDRPGALQRCHEVDRRLARYEVPLVTVLGHERTGARVRAVVQSDDVPVPGQVAGQVAAHDRQSGNADLRFLHPRHRTLTRMRAHRMSRAA